MKQLVSRISTGFLVAIIAIGVFATTAFAAEIDSGDLAKDRPKIDKVPKVRKECHYSTSPQVSNDGVIDYSASRVLFAEENRPNYAVFNSVIDNAIYGDERKFMRITDLTTDQTYREGIIELVPDRQYRVEVFYRNDAASIQENSTEVARNADETTLLVTMPSKLEVGTTGRFTAIISAESTTPRTVSAGLSLTSSRSLYLEYVDGSAVWQKNSSDGIEIIEYERLSSDGVSMGSIGSGEYGTISFVIYTTNVYDPSAGLNLLAFIMGVAVIVALAFGLIAA